MLNTLTLAYIILVGNLAVDWELERYLRPEIHLMAHKLDILTEKEYKECCDEEYLLNFAPGYYDLKYLQNIYKNGQKVADWEVEFYKRRLLTNSLHEVYQQQNSFIDNMRLYRDLGLLDKDEYLECVDLCVQLYSIYDNILNCGISYDTERCITCKKSFLYTKSIIYDVQIDLMPEFNNSDQYIPIVPFWYARETKGASK